jgi:hypothetical protein
MVPNTRLYGAAIALTSGGYSLWSASTAAEMVPSSWFMGVLGAVVVAHGIVLLTAAAERLGAASGPLMIGYSLLMLANQALLATGTLGGGGGMGGGMGTGDGMEMGGSAMTAGMGWDAGMVALAALMLVSGLIMTRGRTAMTDGPDSTMDDAGKM